MERNVEIASRLALALSLAVSSILVAGTAKAETNPYFEANSLSTEKQNSVQVSPHLDRKIQKIQDSIIRQGKEPFAQFPNHFDQEKGPFSRFSRPSPVDRVIYPRPISAVEVLENIQQHQR